MRRSLVVVVLTLATVGGGAEAARAQCPAPEIVGIAPPPQDGDAGALGHFRVGSFDRLLVDVKGADAVEIEWGDGLRQRVGVRGGFAEARHAYRQPGRPQLVATAFAACGAASVPGGLTVPVFPRCDRTRGRDLFQADCDEASSFMRLSAGGLSVDGNWLTAPCRDSFSNTVPRPPEPVARASACAAPDEPYPVDGHLPVGAGQRARIALGAPASRVTIAFTSAEGRLGRRYRARQVGKTGRRWAVRLPSAFGASDRVVVRAKRPAAGRDLYVAGINPG